MSFLGYPKVIPYTTGCCGLNRAGHEPTWNTLRSFVFELCVGHYCENAPIDPLTLTFDSSTPKTIPFLGYPKVIPIPSLNTLDLSFLSYAPDKQTDKQTDSNILPVGNNINSLILSPECVHDQNIISVNVSN